MMTTLRVGGATISFNDAKKFTKTYLSNTTRTWAYPAYDGYPGHAGIEVGRADLLAVALLNAGQKPVETYYGLESLLGSINTRLADPRLRGTLAEATDETIEAIANLYGILDATKPPQVGLTKLSKVLHRKRPELLPLYDRTSDAATCISATPPSQTPVTVPGLNWYVSGPLRSATTS